ncbi:MAG: Eco57I restriction-modification methylase domain-containing protein [Candidatus Helarchaeales archaeon]
MNKTRIKEHFLKMHHSLKNRILNQKFLQGNISESQVTQVLDRIIFYHFLHVIFPKMVPNLLELARPEQGLHDFFSNFVVPTLFELKQATHMEKESKMIVILMKNVFKSLQLDEVLLDVIKKNWSQGNFTILNLISSFNWSITWDEENERIISPLIFNDLYFSNLNAPKKSGSFFTPLHVASGISRKVIRSILLTHARPFAGEGKKEAMLISKELSKEKAETILQSIIPELRILDPAMGTGIFLITILEELLRIRNQIRNLSIRKHDLQDQDDDILDEAFFIQDLLKFNIFGVERDERAIYYCKLQFWLYFYSKLKALSTNDFHAILQKLVLEFNFKKGNSLIGEVKPNNPSLPEDATVNLNPFHWWKEFPSVVSRGGFDAVIGNPPYGDRVLNSLEKKIIERSYLHGTSRITNQRGSKNAAAIFIERSHDLLKENGVLGLIVPNSIARSQEFGKIRDLLLNEFELLEIVDEGAAFKGITLEMLTLIARKKRSGKDYSIHISSNRRSLKKKENWVKKSIFQKHDRFMLYWDEDWDGIVKNARFGILQGKRGAISPKYLRDTKDKRFHLPVLFSGKTIKKYTIVHENCKWASIEIFKSNTMKQATESIMLLATRLDNYIRATLKPAGFVPGDNVLEIFLNDPSHALGEILLIINSKLFSYIVPKYLFNFAERTTWLQSVIHLIPIKKNRFFLLFEQIASMLSWLNQFYHDKFLSIGKHDPKLENCIRFFEEDIADNLVHELYLLPEDQRFLAKELNRLPAWKFSKFEDLLRRQERLNHDSSMKKSIARIKKLNLVEKIEKDPVVKMIEAKKRQF